MTYIAALRGQEAGSSRLPSSPRHPLSPYLARRVPLATAESFPWGPSRAPLAQVKRPWPALTPRREGGIPQRAPRRLRALRAAISPRGGAAAAKGRAGQAAPAWQRPPGSGERGRAAESERRGGAATCPARPGPAALPPAGRPLLPPHGGRRLKAARRFGGRLWVLGKGPSGSERQ